MINIQEKKNRIISYLKEFGPSLPVRIGKVVGLEPFLASTVMSELLNERKVIMSDMKIGASSLFFLEGQEKMLENYADSLKSMEKTAYLRIKEKKLLVDEQEEPAIRVALRAIRDFASPFKYGDKIMWRYSFTPKEEIEEILQPKPKVEEKVIIKETPKVDVKETKIEEKKEPIKVVVKERKIVVKKEPEMIVEGPLQKNLDDNELKPEFYHELLDFLKKKRIDLLEEIQVSQKEIVAKIDVNSDLGKINFLLVAKNKKSVNKEEISACVQRASYSKMPCLILLRKDPTKALRKSVEDNNLLKIESLS